MTKALCVEALINTKLAQNEDDALKQIQKALTSGKALEKFAKMASMLGAPADFTDHPSDYMPKADVVLPVFAPNEGYVAEMKTRDIGLLLVELKGGRTHPLQSIDHATGFSAFCQIGDKVDAKTPLCFVHAQNKADYQRVAAKLYQLIAIDEKKPVLSSPVLKKIG